MKNKVNYFLILLFLVILALAVLDQANPIKTPLGIDSGSYAYIGEQLLNGARLYVDVWDHKGPGVFYTNAFGLWLGQGSRWGIWFVEFLSLVLYAILMFFIILKKWGILPAIAGLLTGLGSLNLALSGGNFTEEYSISLNVVALMAFVMMIRFKKPWFSFVIGVFMVVSGLFRANNIGLSIAICLMILITGIWKQEWRDITAKLLWGMAGCLLAVGTVCLYFIYHGSFQEFLIANFSYNYFYAQNRANDQPWEFLQTFLKGFSVFRVYAWFAVLGYVFSVYETVTRVIFKRHIPYFHALIVCLWPVEIYLSSLSGRGVTHYFVSWTPAMTLMGAALMRGILSYLPVSKKPLFRKIARNSTVGLLAAIIVLFVALYPQMFGYFEAANYRFSGNFQKLEVSSPVVEYITANSKADDSVLVWTGHGSIYFMLHRTAPTPYFYYPWMVDSPYTSDIGKAYYQSMLDHPPVLLVDTFLRNPDQLLAIDPTTRKLQLKKDKNYFRPAFINDVLKYFEANYHFETEVDGFRIYRKDQITP